MCIHTVLPANEEGGVVSFPMLSFPEEDLMPPSQDIVPYNPGPYTGQSIHCIYVCTLFGVIDTFC